MSADEDSVIDSKVFEKLDAAVAKPSFLDMLTRKLTAQPKQQLQLVEPSAPIPQAAAGTSVELPSPSAATPSTDDFLLIEKDDAVDALAHYIAHFIVQCPEARTLTPKQLQFALRSTLQSMKKSRLRQVCSYGQSVYRWGALSYSALQMWRNPWLAQAVLTVLYTASRVAWRRLF